MTGSFCQRIHINLADITSRKKWVKSYIQTMYSQLPKAVMEGNKTGTTGLIDSKGYMGPVRQNFSRKIGENPAGTYLYKQTSSVIIHCLYLTDKFNTMNKMFAKKSNYSITVFRIGTSCSVGINRKFRCRQFKPVKEIMETVDGLGYDWRVEGTCYRDNADFDPDISEFFNHFFHRLTVTGNYRLSRRIQVG